MVSIKKQTNKRKRKVSKKKIKNLKPICLKEVIKRIKNKLLTSQPRTIGEAIKLAVKAAKSYKKISKPRVIPIPKTGGILPLIPIFAGLSALGSIAGGASAIAKVVNDAKSAKEQLAEAQRHNKSMESIAMGKGLYLKPYKTGMGLFL